MSCNMVLFEGTVMDAYESFTTSPSSEVIDVNYKTDSCDVYDVVYNAETRQIEKKFSYSDDKGWIRIVLPNFNGLKPGDKIQMIKL